MMKALIDLIYVSLIQSYLIMNFVWLSNSELVLINYEGDMH